MRWPYRNNWSSSRSGDPETDAVDPGLFHSAFQYSHRVQRVGTLGNGEKCVCGLDQEVKCVIHSFGINGESPFESTRLKRGPGCEVWGYDYNINSWGPPVIRKFGTGPISSPSRSAGQTTTKITTTPNIGRSTRSWISPDHTFIDIFKIDIEGGEFDALTTFLSAHAAAAEGDVLPVGQLQLEIHSRGGHENFEYFARWWPSLEAAGLRPFWTEPNLVYINLVRGVRPELAEVSRFEVRGLGVD
ncbi:hypothetical protein EDB89DRAFT_2091859 [Lactarius sanguifluus]|nr:hypothetical protein EDB89DRAFT_2091859 [Lactarius sanguifluus]